MEVLRKNVGIIAGASAFGVGVKLLSFIKLSHIFGSHAAFFSAGSILSPLSGVYGVGFSGITIFMTMCIKIACGINPLYYVLYHIPSLCGALFWSGSRFITSLVLPLLCMIAFLLHEQGAGAWLYTLYWVIPMFIYASGRRRIFTDALSCTFIMHAVGSVLWLYGANISTAVWINLIPVVFVERLLLAVAMASAYIIMQAATNYIKTKKRAALSEQGI